MRQGSSVVEQGTHKPLVGSSTLPPGTVALKGEDFGELSRAAPAEARPIGIKTRLAGRLALVPFYAPRNGFEFEFGRGREGLGPG